MVWARPQGSGSIRLFPLTNDAAHGGQTSQHSFLIKKLTIVVASLAALTFQTWNSSSALASKLSPKLVKAFEQQDFVYAVIKLDPPVAQDIAAGKLGWLTDRAKRDISVGRCGLVHQPPS